jgi:hypothetical protein
VKDLDHSSNLVVECFQAGWALNEKQVALVHRVDQPGLVMMLVMVMVKMKLQPRLLLLMERNMIVEMAVLRLMLLQLLFDQS